MWVWVLKFMLAWYLLTKADELPYIDHDAPASFSPYAVGGGLPRHGDGAIGAGHSS